jgi:nucleotide-binding universal stress UspA family protein
MTIRKIEVPIFGKEAVDSLLDAATTVATQFDAQIEARFIRPSAADAARFDDGFGFAGASLIDQIEQEGIAVANSAHKGFEAWCAKHAAHPQIQWYVEEGSAGAVVARSGCLADLILLQRAGEKEASIDEPFAAAVYGAGKLAMVTDKELAANFLDHVLIAWNGSTEASRAIGQSLSFLKKAKRVSVFAAGEDGAEPANVLSLLSYLAVHGVTAAPVFNAPVSGNVAKLLIETLDREKVTLLVMGAYTHSRVRQLLFGGVTQYLLTTPGTPALFAH